MSVYLARSECRNGYWHVVTYDISDPEHWQEIGDAETPQPCAQSLTMAFQVTAPGSEAVAAEHVARHSAHLIGTRGSLISEHGHLLAWEQTGGDPVLTHRDASGDAVPVAM
jgi:hypothetical protein